MSKNILAFAVGLMAFQGAQGQINKAGLVQDMVSFERAYIPALALTSDGKVEPSRKAMARLDGAWKAFQQRNENRLKVDSAWASGLAEIEVLIRRAGEIVASGTTFDQAHEALEKVRVILMSLRQRDGIELFPDHLTAFHEPMEIIVLTAKGKTPATFRADDLAKIAQALPEAKHLWQKAFEARFDGGTYGMNADQTRTAQTLMQQESDALEKLEKALASKEIAQILPAAVSIKPPFANLYKLLGDFSGLE